MRTPLRGTADGPDPERSRPRLTIALPLYRSAHFLPVITGNVDVIAAMNEVEVLVSDRHGLDDTLQQLRKRYGADPRFCFFDATDGIGWVAHYNWLLRQGRGTYFAWMPHDDTFPPGHYGGLVAHLDARPDTLLAFGPLVGVSEGTDDPGWTARVKNPPEWNSPEGWGPRDAVRMLRSEPWVPMHGVFRREVIAAAGLDLRPTFCSESADTGFLFGVALAGAIRYVDVPPCIKRRHPRSATRTTMPFTLRSQSSVYRVFIHHLLRHSSSPAAAAAGLLRLASVYASRVAGPRLRDRLALRRRMRRLAGAIGSVAWTSNSSPTSPAPTKKSASQRVKN